MTLRKIILAVIFLIGFVSLNSCKTTKKKGEVSKVGKFYKNTTAYYNGYFNANEIYQNALVVLDNLHRDDYNHILPLYTYRDVPDTKSVSQDLDKVVEKLGRVINLHRVADWVDDSYLLMGKAQYVKQDFEKAQNVFEYFVDEMNPAFKKSNYKTKKSKKAKKKKVKRKKRKKKKKSKKKRRTRKQKEADDKKEAEKKAKEEEKLKKAKSEVVKSSTFHRKGSKKDWETYNEGLLWMAKTYIEREKWASAYYLLTRLRTEYQNKTLKREYPKVKAYYYLKQKNYTEAIEPLQNAISFASDKKEKARLAFILGQVYEKLDNSTKAFAMYQKVGKFKPDYDLEFNAKLKVLKNNSANEEDYVLKEIKNLLKEDKYADYKDNIYYTLAVINMRNNDVPEAIINFNKSIANNKSNPALKAEVYYQLADINFKKQKYIPAKKYYDSTLMVINKTDERYLEIKGLANNLTEIAKNLETIQLQDSLIRISKLPKDEQMALAIAIKKKQLEEKKKEKNIRKSINERKNGFAQSSIGGAEMMRGMGGKMSRIKSSFFIYNKSSLETGKKEFKSKWGTILLEDNWRRSSKSDSDYNDGEDSGGEDEEIALTDIEMNNLLRGVPRTPDQLKMANSRIMSSMLNLGILYREKLGNYKKSADILEQLLNRYSGFDDECKAMYYLQFSYKDLNMYTKANNLVAKMSNSFPDCTYTKVLTDPEFVNSRKNKVNLKEKYYADIFDLYTNGEYEKAQAKINNADEDFKKDAKFAIKLDYLTAKITGKTEGRDKYILALERFIKKYPNSKEVIHAKETLRFIKGDKDTFNKLIYEEDLEKFTYQKNKLHYILIVVHDINDDDLKIIKTSISNYNKSFYKLDRLRMSNIYFDTKGKDQVILLRKFSSADAAMKYYNDVIKLDGDYIDSKYNYEIYAISQKNYREVIKQRSVNNYKGFFIKNYFQEKK